MTKEAYISPQPETPVRLRKRPLGGTVANKPFPQTLYELALSNGYKSQRRLGLALGHGTNTIVGTWYRGESAPTPDNFGALLRLLKPTDEQLDGLVEPYGRLIAQGWGRKGTNSREGVLSRSQKSKKPAETTLGRVIDEICNIQKITLVEMAAKVGFNSATINLLRFKGRKTLPSVSTLTEFLENSLQTLELSEEEIEGLTAGVAGLIEQRLNQGRGEGRVSPKRIRKLQAQTPCQTYLPTDVAKQLGLEREWIRQIRKKLGIDNVILTEDNRQEIIVYQKGHHK